MGQINKQNPFILPYAHHVHLSVQLVIQLAARKSSVVFHMLKHVVVDYSPEVRKQIDTSFALDRCPTYPAHGPDCCSALCPDC